MSAPEVHLVVMAGGSGTRFWPKSTSRRPKQLLGFGASPRTLLQETFYRLESKIPSERRWIVTTAALADAVTAQRTGAHVLGEPQARNTAPCVYWAAREIARKNPRDVMVMVPADHYMARPQDFAVTVDRAVAWASSHDDLVTLGIKPARPETGYGYLHTGEKLEGGANAASGCVRVKAFVEKPNLEKARAFVADGNYLWNGGMFVWRAEVVLRAFDEHMPEMKKAWEAANGDAIKAYPAMTATSIDYGIMEKARNVVTFPLDCGWDDLGSWTSLESLATVLGASDGDCTVTAGDWVGIESRGLIVDAPGRLVATLGVEDLIIVEAGDAILVARKDRAQDIKKIVDEVKKRRPELT